MDFARITLALLAGAAWLVVGCDTLDCGPGTHRAGDECRPNVQVTCGEGTAFRDGHCEPEAAPDGGVTRDAGPGDPLRCGPGTRREGDLCVPEAAVADTGPRPDRGAVFDGGADAGADGGADAGPGTDADPPADATPPPPRCPPELEPGTPPVDDCTAAGSIYCVVGVALDFLTNCALPADQGLIIALIDPLAAAAGAPPLDVVPIGPGGTFALRGTGEATALAVVIDEHPDVPVDRWTRSVSGVLAEAPTGARTYPATAFASSLEAQGRWNQALGLGERGLDSNGFLIARVLAITPEGPAPAAGKTIRLQNNPGVHNCAGGAPCLRYFNDDPRLVGFQPVGADATGRSGAFLLIHTGGSPLQDIFRVDGDAAYSPITAGANPGSGFHTAFVPGR